LTAATIDARKALLQFAPALEIGVGMRVLVLGKSGQVARELARIEWPREISVTQLGRDECDLSDLASLGTIVTAAKPDIVVNVAAYTAVDRAESEQDLAMAVNGHAPGEIAKACSHLGAALIHISTDYVFDGAKMGAYREDDPVCPVSAYGKTKEAGETAIRAALEKHVILRTSWVFAGHGANFVKTMLRLAASRPELRVVADQMGAPTSAADIAQTIAAIADAIANCRGHWGTFHFTSAEPTSWHGFAQAIMEDAIAENVRPKVAAITTADYPTPATRPANSVLDCTRILDAYGIAQPSWRAALRKVLKELEAA
jgi:dTDP-4-dehydrorhamnose reductase